MQIYEYGLTAFCLLHLSPHYVTRLRYLSTNERVSSFCTAVRLQKLKAEYACNILLYNCLFVLSSSKNNNCRIICTDKESTTTH